MGAMALSFAVTMGRAALNKAAFLIFLSHGCQTAFCALFARGFSFPMSISLWRILGVISHQTPRCLPRKAVSYRHCGGQLGQESGQPTSRNVPCSQPQFQGQLFNPYWPQTSIVKLGRGLLCARERTRSAGGLCVMGWGHGFGLIAILIEEVGLGSDDGCSFNKIGATSHDQTIFANTSQSFTPAHDRRHERVGISR
jgi:hypothetical protein